MTFRLTDLIKVDHIKTRFKGVDNTIKNKQFLHRYCHYTKTPFDYKRYPKPTL
ncbi:HNH endonuclease [Trichodesmium erythraeum]|uniref:HNH endonuclease n=1 Tax=Trichodesmium erythraeum TaxID=1206 RepID=UPI0002F66FE8|nr:HNH endonuclease [Trichodesmium erythraeum GBRTRLIN201]